VASLAAFFFAFDGKTATAFASGLAARFTAAQRLICACRMRSRASALSFLCFCLFWTVGTPTDAGFAFGLSGLRLIAADPAEVKRALVTVPYKRQILAHIRRLLRLELATMHSHLCPYSSLGYQSVPRPSGVKSSISQRGRDQGRRADLVPDPP